jgi:excinuclease ABC subunit A
MDVKLTDYIIDIGPEGGKGGGQLIAKGTLRKLQK